MVMRLFFIAFVLLAPASAYCDDIAWSKIIGAKASELDATKKNRVREVLSTLQNTHGCSGTLAHCLSKGDVTARRHAGFVIRMILKGKDNKTIEKQIALRHKSAHPKKTVDIDLGNHPYVGKREAKIVLVEYACFECPLCAHLAPKMKQMKKKFGHNLVMYFKYFPVRSHENGVPSAIAAAAAHLQGKFWPYYDLLFENRVDLEEENLVKFAKKVGLDMEKWQQDRKSPSVLKQVENDKLEGMRIGVDGTPTIFVNGKMFKGSYNIKEIEDRIAEERDILEGRIQ